MLTLMIAFTFSQAPSKDLSKEVPQDNITIVFAVRMKYLVCLPSVVSQLYQIGEGLNFFLPTTSSPFN